MGRPIVTKASFRDFFHLLISGDIMKLHLGLLVALVSCAVIGGVAPALATDLSTSPVTLKVDWMGHGGVSAEQMSFFQDQTISIAYGQSFVIPASGSTRLSGSEPSALIATATGFTFQNTGNCNLGNCTDTYGDLSLQMLFAPGTVLYLDPSNTGSVGYDVSTGILTDYIGKNDNSVQSFSLTPYPASAVPEPASWLMMMGGFALVGGALRRNRSGAVFA